MLGNGQHSLLSNPLINTFEIAPSLKKVFYWRHVIQIPAEVVTPCPMSYSKHIIHMNYYSHHYNPLLHEMITGCLRLVRRKHP